MLLFCTEDKDEEIVSEIAHPGLDAFRLFPYALDIRDHVIQKSDGIKKVLDYFGLKKENTLALGDDVQDVSMFELCKYSAAMENGVEKAKSSASFVTTHIDCHGVKKALKYFKVI